MNLKSIDNKSECARSGKSCGHFHTCLFLGVIYTIPCFRLPITSTYYAAMYSNSKVQDLSIWLRATPRHFKNPS